MSSGPGVVAFVLMAILLPLAVNEARDWCPRLASWLVRWAARRLGNPQARSRYEEEWAANIEAVPGKLSPLVSAVGYLIALPRMRQTLRRAQRPVTKPIQLPLRAANFTGRLEEFDTLTNALIANRLKRRRSTPTIVAVCGTAGVGKTTLVVHWAHLNKDRFPDGILYAHFGNTGHPRDPGVVLEQFLRALGVRPADVPANIEEQTILYRQLVSRQRMLIVLDGAETADQVRPFLPDSAKPTVLITSRNRLAPLDRGNVVALRELDIEEAIDLLQATVGPDRIHAAPRAARELVMLCGRYPLAIRIAAERLARHPHMSVKDLVKDLQDEPLCDALSAEDNNAVRGLRTLFDWSYQALPAEAARLFRRLAVLPSSRFTRHEAATLVDGDGSAATDKILEVLCNAHLVEKSLTPGVYWVHDLLLACAQERLRAEEPHPIPALRNRKPSTRRWPLSTQRTRHKRYR